MLIKFFRSSYLINYLVMFFIGLLLWGRSFIFPVEVIPSLDIYPFYSIIYYWLGDYEILFSVLGFLLLFFESLLINSIVTESEITTKNSLLPGFLYILLMSFSPELLTLHPVLISNVFLILILKFAFQLYGQKEPYNHLYRIGLILGVCTLYYFPAYLFLIYIFWFLFFLRSLSLRELIIPLVGFITPYIFMAVWYFSFDQIEFVYDDYLGFFQSIHLIDVKIDIITKIILVVIALIFLISFLYFATGKYYEKLISTRKKIKLSFFFLIISVLPVILYGDSKMNHLLILAVPATILISSYFSALKKIFFMSVLTILLILLMIINNYKLMDVLYSWIW